MPLKNLLVALDRSAASEAALAAAVAMQPIHRAHLTGFVAEGGALRLSAGENTWIPRAIAASLQKSSAAAVAGIEARFRKATADLDSDKIHLIDIPEAGDTSIARASRFFDVTLVGMPPPSARASDLHPDRIALLSGRPVIAFPPEHDATRSLNQVLIAWDGTRAAARALSSAIRMLGPHDVITIVTIGDPPQASAEAPGLDPKTALDRQGLSASWVHIPESGGGVAAMLLDKAREIRAGLIIMGAYEHSKFREDIFGGVTHDVMAATDVPVYLAH